MIVVGNFYRCNTSFGVRTVKAIQELESSDFYGIFSISNYEEKGDNQGMVIPNSSKNATEEEIEDWNNWYNS